MLNQLSLRTRVGSLYHKLKPSDVTYPELKVGDVLLSASTGAYLVVNKIGNNITYLVIEPHEVDPTTNQVINTNLPDKANNTVDNYWSVVLRKK